MKEIDPLVEFARAVRKLEFEVYFLEDVVYGDAGELPDVNPRTTRRH